MITGIVLAVIIVAVAGAGLVVSNGKTVYPNVTVKGSPVGGLTREQAVSALEGSGWNEAGEFPYRSISAAASIMQKRTRLSRLKMPQMLL